MQRPCCFFGAMKNMFLLLTPLSDLEAWGTRFPLGVPFARAKGTKTRLGRSPLSTPLDQNPLRAFPPKYPPGVRGWPCVKTRFGPSPLLWLLSLPPHQATLGSWPYSQAISTSGPILAKRRSRRREPSFRSLGTAAHQGKALGIEALSAREVGTFCRISTPSM